MRKPICPPHVLRIFKENLRIKIANFPADLAVIIFDVEKLDVPNPAGKLSPGMFAEVAWTMRRQQPSLFVPPSAVATTTERTFVVRIRNGQTEWVDVRRGAAMKQLIEVFGDLRAGDQVALRGTDELRAGTKVQPKAVTQATLGQLNKLASAQDNPFLAPGITVHTTPTSRFPITSVQLQRWHAGHWVPFGGIQSAKP